MTATNCTSNRSIWCLANHPNSISVWIKFWLENGQTNVLPDARLTLRLLTPSRTIFHTVNRKYFARKNHQPQVRTDVLKDSRKSSSKRFLIYNNKHIPPFKGQLLHQNICTLYTLLQIFKVLLCFGELIAIGMRLDMVDETDCFDTGQRG